MADSELARWVLRFGNLDKACSQLKLACEQDNYSNLELAGLVKSFEFTFELAWKTMKDKLEIDGYEINSPREAIRSAFAARLIDDARPWLDALLRRNLMAHTYSEQTAAATIDLIKKVYAPMLVDLVETLRGRLSEGEDG